MATSGALFPSLVPGARGTSNKYLVEFRAGKMSLKGTTVTPDKRKGLVYIQQTDDSLIHFCWKDRTSGSVEDVSGQGPPTASLLQLGLSCHRKQHVGQGAERGSHRRTSPCLRTPADPRPQDLIIFPDDCEFKRVPQCPSGRVYVLKFKAGSKRLFFWMQVCGLPAALRPAAGTCHRPWGLLMPGAGHAGTRPSCPPPLRAPPL